MESLGYLPPESIKAGNRSRLSHEELAAYPIVPGQTVHVGPHQVTCLDLEEQLPLLFASLGGRGIDALYVDPPWGAANASTFRRKAGMPRTKADYGEFRFGLIEVIRRCMVPFVMEMGLNWSTDWAATLASHGVIVNGIARGTYYRKNPVNYIVGGIPDSILGESLVNALRDKDDEYGPGVMLDVLKPTHIFDPCCGRGLTARHALYRGVRFTGNELAPYRAAATLEVLHHGR